MKRNPIIAAVLAALLFLAAPVAYAERFGPAPGTGAMVGSLTGHLTGGVTLKTDSTGNVVPNTTPSVKAGIYVPTTTGVDVVDFDDYVGTHIVRGVGTPVGYGLYTVQPHGTTTTGAIQLSTTSTILNGMSADTTTGSLTIASGVATTLSGAIYLTSGASDTTVGGIGISTGAPAAGASGGSVTISTSTATGAGANIGNIFLYTGDAAADTEAAAPGSIVLQTDGTSTANASSTGILLATGNSTGTGATAQPIVFYPGAGPTSDNDGFVTVHTKNRGVLQIITDEDFVGGTGTEFGVLTINSDLGAANVAAAALLPNMIGDNNGQMGLMVAPLSVGALGANKSRAAIAIYILGNSLDNAAAATYGINIGDGGTVPSKGASLRISSRTPYAIDTTISNGPGFLRWGGADASIHTGTCGTNPSISGNNQLGTVTTGTGSPTSCQVDFSGTRASNPICRPTARSGTVIAYISADPTTSAFVFSLSAGTSGLKVDYSCAEK